MIKVYTKLPFLDFIKKILSSGIDEFTSRPDNYRISSINRFSFFCLVISFPYYVIFYVEGLFLPFIVILITHILFSSTIWFNNKRHFLFSNLSLLLATNGSVLALSLMLGSDSGFHLYIYTSPLFVFWLFGTSKFKLILYTFFIYVGLMVLVFLADSEFGSYYNFNFNYLGFNLYRFNALLNLFLIFLLFYNYFQYQNLLTNDLLDKQKSLQEEIEKRIHSENQTSRLFEDLSLSYKNLEQFSFVVSHNMRSPVANIKGFLNLYDKKVSSAENLKIIEYSENAACNLEKILEDLNHILKNRNTILERKEVIIFQDLIGDVCDTLSLEIENTKAQIKTKLLNSDSIFSIRGILSSILYNLFQNSIKYRNNWEPPILSISLEKQASEYILTVQDNGIGIDLKKYNEKVFTLYSRFHRNTEGKGIGLYLVKMHVEMLGGQISVESEVNQGSVFTIKLPL
ncbi:MAG: HAMP domain-containing histidine kinase [Opitutaceae bacterium]|nr:HAMP domain-containing histidine kinase [Cytophagales bacterium]